MGTCSFARQSSEKEAYVPRPDVPPAVADEIEKYLAEFGEEGGSWLDIFQIPGCTLGETVIRNGLLTLERAERAYREPRHRGRKGREPDVWRAGQKPQEREDA